MRTVKKITILEFAPCADTVYWIRHDAREGYLSATDESVTIRAGVRLRPHEAMTFAGGKATNVARVMDKLLEDGDAVEVDLIVFRTDSPEGRYIHDLQTAELKRVRVRPVIVDSTARFCINLSDPASPGGRVEFNISPYARWQRNAVDIAIDTATQITTDLLLLAGNPPVLEPDLQPASDLPSRVIESIHSGAAISIDTSGAALAKCLSSVRQPNVVKINREEFASVSRELWSKFKHTLVVTDSGGCDVYENGPDGPSTRINAPRVETVYSTVGAGDAAHAGLMVALWVRGFEPIRAARFGMAAAAGAVGSTESTRGVMSERVRELFDALEKESR